MKRFHTRQQLDVIPCLIPTWRVLCTTLVMMMTDQPNFSPAAASAMLGELVVRSFGLAAGVGACVLLAAALFTG